MQIKKNTVVSLTYTLREASAEGRVIEITKESDPLVFLYGVGQMLPRFEENLADLLPGTEYAFAIPCVDAYGEVDNESVIDLEKDIFKIDGKIDDDMLRPGNVIPMRDESGHMLQGVVEQVNENSVRMNFNHPLAGTDLHFTGKILDVREATADELSHGHVHGEGGHHH